MELKRLHDAFPPELIKWRVGATNRENTKGMALAYADARAFMDRLDEICGPQNWQDEYFDSPSGRVFCKVGIKIDNEWIWKADGAGETQVEGEKGAISDAFKRACVKWGLGRYLYDLKSPWVEIEKRGKSYVISQNAYGQLNALLGGKQPKAKQAPPKPQPAPQPEAPPPFLTEEQEARQDEFIQSLQTADSITVRLVCNYAVGMAVGYKAEAHALNALKSVKGKDALSYDDAIDSETAVKMLTFLIDRKLAE